MYCLIDGTNYRALACHPSWAALNALAHIQFTNLDTATVGLSENKHLAAYDATQLKSIYDNVGTGGKVDTKDYQKLLKATRELLLSATHLQLPFDADELEAQAACIDKDDDRPYDFVPGGTKPTRAKCWLFSPQRNRPRTGKYKPPYPELLDTGPKAPRTPVPAPAPKAPPAPAPAPAPKAPAPAPKPAASAPPVATAGGKGRRGKGAASEAPPAPAEGASEAPAKAARAKAVRAPKGTVREERNGVERPNPGSNGEKMWAAFSKLAEKGSVTPQAAREAGTKLGMNENSVSASFSRWRRFHGVK